MILKQTFYNRPAVEVAQDLLGCFLIRKIGDNTIKTRIAETEAYAGPHDLACHASKGCTERNKVMFGPPGFIYVYFTYGMHYMLNIVTEKAGYPAAVLIRAVEPYFSCHHGRNEMEIRNPEILLRNPKLTNGPAKLTKALKIDKSFYGLPIFKKTTGLWIEGRKEIINTKDIVATARIGIDYAKDYRDKPWRFYIKNNPFISKK